MKKNKKILLIVLLILAVSWFMYILQRDIRRQGSLQNAIRSWTYYPLFGLHDSDTCYELRLASEEHGLILVKRDNLTDEERHPGVPDGSVMRVASTDFDPQPYLDECHRFDGYFLLRDTVKWHLTKVTQ